MGHPVIKTVSIKETDYSPGAYSGGKGEVHTPLPLLYDFLTDELCT